MVVGFIKMVVDFIKKRGLTFVVGFVFAAFCFVTLNMAMKPVSTSQYCGSNCHEMNTAYQTWELSVHGANKSGVSIGCVDCHLPAKDKYFTHIAAKAYTGAKDLYKHHFGDEYDIEKIRSKVLDHLPSQRCMNCHNDLLARPSNSKARIAHIASLNTPDAEEHRCVKCHDDTGHERQRKIFSE